MGKLEEIQESIQLSIDATALALSVADQYSLLEIKVMMMAVFFSNLVDRRSVMHSKTSERPPVVGMSSDLLRPSSPASFPMKSAKLLHHGKHYLVICNSDFMLLY